MKHTLQLFVIFGLLHFSNSIAQTTIEISLEEALQLTKEQNIENRLKVLEYEQSKAEKQTSNSLFLPKVSVSETGIRTNNPLAAFGFLLQQRQVQNTDFNPDLLNNPGNRVNWNTQLLVEQPLINVDGYYGRKAATAQTMASSKILERTTQQIEQKVKEVYFALQVAAEHKKVLNNALKAINEAFRIAEDNQNEGYLKHLDVMKLNVRKLEIEYQIMEAGNTVLNTSSYLAFLIQGDANAIYVVTDSITIDNSTEEEVTTVASSRADFQAMEYGVQAYSYQLKMNRAQFIPRLNAFGQYNLNSEKLFGTQADNYLVGISLNWNLFDGGNNLAKAKVSTKEWERASLQLEQTKQQANLALQQANRDVLLSKNKLQLLQKSIEEAEEAYRITNNQFQEGLATVANLLEAETLLSTSRLEYQNGLYAYYIALANRDLQAY